MFTEHPIRRAGAAMEGTLLAGIAAIFFVNAVSAVVAPDSFESLLEASALTRAMGIDAHGWLVPVIAVNDAFVALGAVVAVPVRRVRRSVLGWAGAWLGLAAVLKLTALA